MTRTRALSLTSLSDKPQLLEFGYHLALADRLDDVGFGLGAEGPHDVVLVPQRRDHDDLHAVGGGKARFSLDGADVLEHRLPVLARQHDVQADQVVGRAGPRLAEKGDCLFPVLGYVAFAVRRQDRLEQRRAHRIILDDQGPHIIALLVALSADARSDRAALAASFSMSAK